MIILENVGEFKICWSFIMWIMWFIINIIFFRFDLLLFSSGVFV